MDEDKTDVLLVTAKRIVNLQHLPEFMHINGTCIKFSPSVRNLGVTLDSTLSLHQHVMNVCRVAYFELRCINSIRNLLSVDAVKTLVCSLVLSRLDYCNSLLVGLPQYLIKRLQGVQNVATRSILRTPRSEHISPLLQNLHWLPVNRRILHKVAALCDTFLSGYGPQYLSDLTHVYTPSRSLRSSSDTRILSTPNVKLKSYDQRSLPPTVPLHGILCHSHSDINRNLIASSEL